jgi:hypothetical protein
LTEFVAAPKRFLDEAARFGGCGSALEKMVGDAFSEAICGAHGKNSGSSAGARHGARLF